MLLIRLMTLTISLAFYIAFAHAQLGPKNGADLNPTDLERIRTGEMAPDFTLENIDGKRFTLSDFRGRKNVVLVFYRGYW